MDTFTQQSVFQISNITLVNSFPNHKETQTVKSETLDIMNFATECQAKKQESGSNQ